MKILITGGNGFLGFHTINHLIKMNHELLVISKNNSRLKLLNNSKFDFINCHLDSINIFRDRIESFSPDIVIHYGWYGGNSFKDIMSFDQFNINLPQGINFLNLIKDLKKKPKFIGFGTYSEYGIIDKNIPITETYLEQPNSYYGLSKLIFNNYSRSFCQENFINWVWCRPCYIYGPNNVETRLLETTFQKLKNNQRIILDDCTTLIDLLYIDDYLHMFYKLIMSDNYGIYNFSSGQIYILKDIILKMKEIFKSKSEIVFDEKLNRSNVQKYVCADNEKIKNITNYHKFIDLETGLMNSFF